MSFNFSLVLTCFHFCEEDRISTGMNLWIHGERKRSRKRSLLWEVGREDSVSLVFVMLLMSDILTENSFKALLYRFQTPPLLYVTEWVFMWSLLLATLGLHSDLHKYMADGEDRPLSLALYPSLLLSVFLMLGSDWLCLSEESEEIALIHRVCVFVRHTARLQVCR